MFFSVEKLTLFNKQLKAVNKSIKVTTLNKINKLLDKSLNLYKYK